MVPQLYVPNLPNFKLHVEAYSPKALELNYLTPKKRLPIFFQKWLGFHCKMPSLNNVQAFHMAPFLDALSPHHPIQTCQPSQCPCRMYNLQQLMSQYNLPQSAPPRGAKLCMKVFQEGVGFNLKVKKLQSTLWIWFIIWIIGHLQPCDFGNIIRPQKFMTRDLTLSKLGDRIKMQDDVYHGKANMASLRPNMKIDFVHSEE